jgi:hypothetical protein
VKIKAFGVAAVLLLAGCASVGLETDKQKIEAACIAASGSVRVLAVANTAGKLTADQWYMVTVAVATIMPICGADAPPTLTVASREAFLGAVSELQVYAMKAEGTSP